MLKRNFNISYFRNQLENWIKTIDVKANRVLDVGGGALPVKGRTKSWQVGEYRVLDNELEEMRHGKPDIIQDINIPEVYDSKNLPDYGRGVINKPFDIVFCLEIFEYVWNPVGALKCINGYLRNSGILYISFPFIYPMHEPIEHDCLRYTKFGVIKLLKEAGFEIQELIPRVELSPVSLIDFFAKEGMHPTKKDFIHNHIGYCVKAIKK